AQPRRLHALLLLPVAGARAAAGLVQVGPLPLARRRRSARRPRRLRRRAAGGDRDPRLGLDGRDPVPGPAHAPGRHRRLERGAARRARHRRLDDRRGTAGAAVNGAHDMGGKDGFGPVEPEPDEPPFHAAWERRIFALTLAMAAPGGWNLDMSRAARESLPDYLARSYYEIWLAGLEKLLLERG